MSAIGTLRSRERTAKIAKARLTEKLQKINDVYGRLDRHLESLETLESELRIGLVERANRIDGLLTEVAEMIGNHRSNLMSKFNETSQLLNSVFDQQKRICKKVLEQAKQVRLLKWYNLSCCVTRYMSQHDVASYSVS